MDVLLVGRHLRARRRAVGWTLEELGAKVGMAPSQLSMFENGRREPRLSQLDALADALGLAVADLLVPDAPDARTAMELELDRYQRQPLYAELHLPTVPPTRALPQPVLESLVGLHRELRRRAEQAIATPEEARRANTELRLWLRSRDNHLPEFEQAAADLLAVVDHRTGALKHHDVGRMAKHLGFSLIHVNDLPHSTRSVIDLENGRIYLPPASIPGGHGLRALALQAMAHRVLGHTEPRDYAEFLRQRLEINYFAAACLMPQEASVAFLRAAKDRRDLAIEDFRDAFGVTHEAAALRLMNLATVHLGLPVHFLRVRDDGAIQKAYENDGLPLPADVSGSVEGQLVHPAWAARAAFERTNRTTEFYQFTDTPAGTYWCSTQTGTSATEEFSITVGVRFADSKWFRGADTAGRADARVSGAPRSAEEAALVEHWRGKAWPSARLHAHVLAPLPAGTFPGVDDEEVYRFLEVHASR
ncbi:helix-turn-helix domain-containing protein [Amnibacterium kyonggiense]|uniref:Transcriptional regulator n=1 Tax=Amnibacterium kyonggiense TaxID=595671 RepID=A0A4R7FSF4_9MICO|nr:helix-turn-helix domain-containing protein [Amnibacterium kyonggiense]TDS80797.1 transcriptional regulator [Amnibacterium kyonggiense]